MSEERKPRGLARFVASDRSRSAVVSSAVGIAQRLLQVLGTLVTMPLVLHALGTQGFGLWGAAASLAWMTATFDLGIGSAMVTAIARALARNDMAEARSQITAALCLTLVLSGMVLTLAVIVIDLDSASMEAVVYLIATAALALNIPTSLAAGIWIGSQRAYIAWGWEAVQTVLTVGGLYALTCVTTDVRYYVAVTFGGVLATSTASLIHLMLRHPELRPLPRLPRPAQFTSLVLRGMPYLILGLAQTLAVHSDNIVALSLLGQQDAARMAVAQRACMTALGLLWVLTQPLWPAFTDAAVRQDYGWLRTHVLRGAVVVTVCAIGGAMVLVAFGEPLLDLWLRGGLTVDRTVLTAMAIWIVIPALGRIPDVLLNALGVVWFQVGVAVVYSGLAFALKFTLAPQFGIAGILAATGISYGLTHLPLYIWWVRRWLQRASLEPVR